MEYLESNLSDWLSDELEVRITVCFLSDKQAFGVGPCGLICVPVCALFAADTTLVILRFN